jgi:kinesin family protein 5
LTSEDLTSIRRQLSEGQNLLKETVDRLRQSQEENEMLLRRKDELENRITSLETEYEDLLGEYSVPIFWLKLAHILAEKTINDEETSNVDLAEAMSDLKVWGCPSVMPSR